jgi:beta-glucanase (GH16 family)
MIRPHVWIAVLATSERKHFVDRLSLCTVFVALLTVIAGPFVGPASAKPPAGFSSAPVWRDEFSGSKLDPGKWKHVWLGPRRNAISTADAVSVNGGKLKITTYTDGGVHYSGCISTKDTFSRKYGYFEASINFNGSPGMWSGFWMYPPNIQASPGNPRVAGTEMDIVEQSRVDQKNADRSGICNITVHWWGDNGRMESEHHHTPNLGLGVGHHLYGLAWTPTECKFYVDDKLQFTFAKAVSQRSEYMILSSSVMGGTSWVGTTPREGYGSLKDSKTNMVVDYVRVYAMKSEESSTNR